MKLLIDGENFRHQIAGVLLKHKKITNKNDYFDFDFAGFCQEILQTEELEIEYFTTKIKQPKFKIPKSLSNLIKNINVQNRRWIAQLTNQKVKIIKAGYLKVRQSNACIHCGKKTLVLQEKGVDVRVATELVMAARTKTPKLALASSDSDIVPAIEVAHKLGAQIIYVCYDQSLNRSVAANAQRTVTFSDKDVIKFFGK